MKARIISALLTTLKVVSVDESKVSVLILGFIATLSVALWSFIVTKKFNSDLLTLLGYEIGGIAGINIFNRRKR